MSTERTINLLYRMCPGRPKAVSGGEQSGGSKAGMEWRMSVSQRVLTPVKFVDGFDPIVDVHLFVDMIHMFADGFLADEEFGGDLLV
jgi:hypothetical protein